MFSTVLSGLFLAFLGMCAFMFIMKKPYYSLAFYYFCNFARRFLVSKMQVRYQVSLQLAFIGFCVIATCIGNQKNRAYEIRTYGRRSISELQNGRLLVGAVVLIDSLIGIINGYSVFQIAVDVYKVAEIFLFYYFLRYTWKNTWEIEKCIRVVLVEMCLFGIVEVFTTERGGIATNIMMSFFPLIFAVGFYQKVRSYWIFVIMALVVLLSSKTRTYMLGTMVGILVVLLYAHGNNSKSIRTKGVMGLICLVIMGELYMTLIGNEYIESLINRILALGDGFEASGGYRIFEIGKAIEKFYEAPIWGKGYGYLEYVYIELMGWFEWGDFMHNAYVEILAKTGIVGSLLYGIGLLGFVNGQRRRIKQSRFYDNNKATGVLIGGLAGTCCWLLTYFAAPLSSYGYVFLPGMIGMLYYENYIAEGR